MGQLFSPICVGGSVGKQGLLVGVGTHFRAIQDGMPEFCWRIVVMAIYVVRNHRRGNEDAVLAGEKEIREPEANLDSESLKYLRR